MIQEAWIWGLVSSLLMLAIGTTLKAVESSHSLKLANEEIARLRKQLETIQEETKNLSSQAGNANTVSQENITPFAPERLEKIKEDILILLSNHPDAKVEYVARFMSVGHHVALHHLEALQKLEYTSQPG